MARRPKPGRRLPFRTRRMNAKEIYAAGRLLYMISAAISLIASVLVFAVAEMEERNKNETPPFF